MVPALAMPPVVVLTKDPSTQSLENIVVGIGSIDEGGCHAKYTSQQAVHTCINSTISCGGRPICFSCVEGLGLGDSTHELKSIMKGHLA